MAYTANVRRMMIASPSDTIDARDAVESAAYGWNDANAQAKQAILQPWRWETSSAPTLGDHPQSLIKSQGVDESDVVFALFGSRLGSSTPDAVSGTVAEIERAIERGKPVHLYFFTAPLANDVDTAQLEGLRAFKAEISQRGLLGEFNNISQLEHQVGKAIVFEAVGEHTSMHLTAADTPTTIHARQTRRLNVAMPMGGGIPTSSASAGPRTGGRRKAIFTSANGLRRRRADGAP